MSIKPTKTSTAKPTTKHRKLQINKETVRDLSVNDQGARHVKGGKARPIDTFVTSECC